MKKQKFPLLIILTIAFSAFTLGFYFGQNRSPDPVTLSVPSHMTRPPAETTPPQTEESLPEPTISFPLDLNIVGKEDLTYLPGIGEVLAQRIIAYRNEHGSFSSVEELLNVEGIGKKRFESIYDLISIGG